MNFKRLGSSTASTTSTDSKLVRTFRSVRNWFIPRTAEGRKMKLTLYKDIGIFIIATTLICIFKDEIKKVFEEDPALSQGFEGLGI